MKNSVIKLCLLVSVLFIYQACPAQEHRLSKDSVDFYFGGIDNNSVKAVHGHFSIEGMDSGSKILYSDADKYIIDKLIDSLDNRNKTLACHILLTLLLDSAGGKVLYHTTEDMTEKIFFLYRYNGFAWKEIFDKTNLIAEIQIDSAEMKNIKTYWIAAKESSRYKQLTQR